MRDWLILIAHLMVTAVRIVIPGARAIITESLLLKHQLLILNRPRKKASRLHTLDRILLGLIAILVSPATYVESRSGREARDLVALSPGADPTQVSMAVFTQHPASPRPQGDRPKH